MAMGLKSKEEVQLIRKAGQIVAACHKAIARRIAPGVTTLEIDRFAERYMLERGALPAKKGYHGYPYAISASVNEVVCHGLPDSEPLSQGDIVKIDMVADINGWKVSSAWTYPIGDPAPEISSLLDATKLALNRGIMQAKPGKCLNDINHAIALYAERAGYQVITDCDGQGNSRIIHESLSSIENPMGSEIPGQRLKEGMIITIESILTAGQAAVGIAANGWTARTNDGSVTAKFEHTVSITDAGPIILTK